MPCQTEKKVVDTWVVNLCWPMWPKVGGTADVSMPAPWNLAYGWASEPSKNNKSEIIHGSGITDI